MTVSVNINGLSYLEALGALFEEARKHSKHKNMSKEQLIADLDASCREVAAGFKGTKYSKSHADEAFALYEERQRAAAISELVNSLKFNPSEQLAAKQELSKYMQLLLGREAAATELAILMQFFWLVKRHLLGWPIRHQIMPVLVGPQGSGKTHAVMRLLKPLAAVDLVWETDFSALDDPRFAPSRNKNYVCFLDEMARASKTDVASLKRIITEANVMYRPMRTNELVKIKNNVSLIGCSNEPINELVRDKTGMRRFFSINLNAEFFTNKSLEEKKAYWKGFNDVDVSLIWRSAVDESAEYVQEFSDAFDAIATIQDEELTAADMFEEFLADKGYVKTGTHAPPNDRIIINELLRDYVEFLKEMHSYVDQGIDPKALRNRLKNRGWAVVRSNNEWKVDVINSKKGKHGMKLVVEGGK